MFTLLAALSAAAGADAPPFIDVHAHFQTVPVNDVRASARTALALMDQFGIRKSLLMPPPMNQAGTKNWYDIEDLIFLVREQPGRFAILGGSSLNVMLHSIAADRVDDAARARFRARAEQIADLGAVGYGEIAVLHVSIPAMGPRHPYENIPADHPLLLLLADIAAERGLPIDLHYDLVPQDMPLPPSLRANPLNPDVLPENLSAFKRLLAHNPRTTFVWSHVGFEPLLTRGPQRVRALLTQFPNLYMSFRINRGAPRPAAAMDMNGTVKPEWVALVGEFADRFMLGSDSFYDPAGSIRRGSSEEAMENFHRLLAALPEPVRNVVATGNAERVYHLLDRPAQ